MSRNDFYRLLTATVVPRPIARVSTTSADGKRLPRALAEGPADAGAAKSWRAGPTEPGNVLVMFFQTPIYE